MSGLQRETEAFLRRLDTEGYTPAKLCRELPADFHNRPEQLRLLECFGPLTEGRHEGPHINRAGDEWAQARRLSPIERVPEAVKPRW